MPKDVALDRSQSKHVRCPLDDPGSLRPASHFRCFRWKSGAVGKERRGTQCVAFVSSEVIIEISWHSSNLVWSSIRSSFLLFSCANISYCSSISGRQFAVDAVPCVLQTGYARTSISCRFSAEQCQRQVTGVPPITRAPIAASFHFHHNS